VKLHQFLVFQQGYLNALGRGVYNKFLVQKMTLINTYN
jgi:hypothetical protein